MNYHTKNYFKYMFNFLYISLLIYLLLCIILYIFPYNYYMASYIKSYDIDIYDKMMDQGYDPLIIMKYFVNFCFFTVIGLFINIYIINEKELFFSKFKIFDYQHEELDKDEKSRYKNILLSTCLILILVYMFLSESLYYIFYLVMFFILPFKYLPLLHIFTILSQILFLEYRYNNQHLTLINSYEVEVNLTDDIISNLLKENKVNKILVDISNNLSAYAFSNRTSNIIIISKDVASNKDLIPLVYHEMGHINKNHAMKIHYIKIGLSVIFLPICLFFHFMIRKEKIKKESKKILSLAYIISIKIYIDILKSILVKHLMMLNEYEADKYGILNGGKEFFFSYILLILKKRIVDPINFNNLIKVFFDYHPNDWNRIYYMIKILKTISSN